jgi:hypothetical protein
MHPYPILGTRRERLVVWLQFHGLKLQRRKGAEFVRVDRRTGGPIKLWLRDDGRTAFFVGDRVSHRSRPVELLMRDWNEAEMYVPGGTHSRVLVELAGKADHDVQSMADYYAATPIGLESIGAADVRRTWNAKRQRVEESRFVLISGLVGLVTSLTTRQAYVDELARRDDGFLEQVSSLERAS